MFDAFTCMDCDSTYRVAMITDAFTCMDCVSSYRVSCFGIRVGNVFISYALKSRAMYFSLRILFVYFL